MNRHRSSSVHPGQALRLGLVILSAYAGWSAAPRLYGALLNPRNPTNAEPAFDPSRLHESAAQNPELERQRALAQILAHTRNLQQKKEYKKALDFLFRLQPKFGELPEVMVVKARLSVLAGETDRGLEIIDAAYAAYPEHIEVMRTRADLFFAAGNLAAALETARTLLPYIPYEESVIRQVADLSLILEGPEQALGYYRDLAEQQPDNPETLALYGQVLFKMHRLEMAAEVQRKVLDVDPRSADACVNLGATLFKLDRHKEATSLFIRAAQLQPDHPEALFNLTVAALTDGQNEEALRLINAHLQQHPTQQKAWRAFWVALSRRLASLPDGHIENPPGADADWHHEQMMRFFKEGDWLRAVRHELRAFILSPDNPTYLNNLAALLHEDMPGASAMVFRLMVLQDPEHSAARKNLDRLNRIWRLAELQRQVEAQPESAEAHWALATFMADSGDIEKSIQYFQRACELGSENTAYFIGLSKALSFLGQHRKAVETYQTVLDRATEEAVHRNRMAWLLLRLSDPRPEELEAARRLASQAVKIESENPDYTATLAQALHRQGKLRRAQATAEKAIRLAREGENPVVLKWIQERLADVLANKE